MPILPPHNRRHLPRHVRVRDKVREQASPHIAPDDDDATVPLQRDRHQVAVAVDGEVARHAAAGGVFLHLG